MSRQRTTTIRMHWCEHGTADGHDVLKVGGISPGGESIRVNVVLGTIGSITYVADQLDKALRTHEDSIARARQRIARRQP